MRLRRRRSSSRLAPPLAALAILSALPAAADDWRAVRPPPKDGQRYPECYCTNRGQRVEIGQRACLRVDGRAFTALCFMSQNSPGWRREHEGCPPEVGS
jgi:hypothetical protein